MTASPTLNQWLQTPRGRLLLRWERELLARLWNRFYGHSALTIGSWGEHLPALPSRWRVAALGHDAALPGGAMTDLRHLPVVDGSVDLVILRHSLAFAPSPHQLLREADRVLSQRGQLLMLNLAPWSAWGMAAHLPWKRLQWPEPMRPLRTARLVDWLHLLDFRIEAQGSYGQTLQPWMRRFGLDAFLQPGYFIMACKQRYPVQPLAAIEKTRQPAFGAVALPPARGAARIIEFPSRPPR
ncbi:MAG: methyltransferase domain-containing protein [Oceanococcaceae bacterium]